jgi:hypothetical protein
LDENIVFLDKDELITNLLESESINFGSPAENLMKLKTKLFALYFTKVSEKFKEFKFVGVNEDEEKIKDWNVQLILFSKDETHKLFKLCSPENEYFAIFLQFDKKCEEFKNMVEAKEILKVEIKKDEASGKLKESLMNKNESFLEKSEITKTEKNYSIDDLANKFSVQELNKIKFLLKFAKRNKVLDKIYEKEGDIELSELTGSNNSNRVNSFGLQQDITDQNSKLDKLLQEINAMKEKNKYMLLKLNQPEKDNVNLANAIPGNQVLNPNIPNGINLVTSNNVPLQGVIPNNVIPGSINQHNTDTNISPIKNDISQFNQDASNSNPVPSDNQVYNNSSSSQNAFINTTSFLSSSLDEDDMIEKSVRSNNVNQDQQMPYHFENYLEP